MNSGRKSFKFLVLSFLLVLAGVWWYWPLALLGVLWAAWSGSFVAALGLALLVDLLWGVPTGALNHLYFPVVLFALSLLGMRLFAARYFLDRTLPGRL